MLFSRILPFALVMLSANTQSNLDKPERDKGRIMNLGRATLYWPVMVLLLALLLLLTAPGTASAISPRIAAGGNHTAVLMTDGTVKTWGSNVFGQLGNGTMTGSSSPVTVIGLEGTVTAIAAGSGHTVALMADGTVKSWGSNAYGQLGNGTKTDSSIPVTVSGLGGTAVAVAAVGAHTVALMVDGTVKCWGYNRYGQLGNGSTIDSSIPVTVTGLGGAAISITAGSMHTAAIMANGTVKSWGYNNEGGLGIGSTADSSVPVTVTGLGGSAVAITAGGRHTAVLLADGTVMAWGLGWDGELGNGDYANSSIPVKVGWLQGKVTAIGAGQSHTVALMADGTVKSWGNGYHGQLGDGTTASRGWPAEVSGLGGTVTAISVGSHHTVALMGDGTVKAWGDNTYGQLGDGAYSSSSVPVQISGLGAATVIAAANNHTLALTADGAIKSWGSNSNGQLGNGTATCSSIPITVATVGGTVTAIDAGWGHSLALTADGTVMGWGSNFFGQLGNGTETSSYVPGIASGLGGTVKAIASGTYAQHTVALMADGTLRAWGSNAYGQLGDGTTTNSSIPVTILGLGGTVTAIAAGSEHTVALMADGTVKTWGSNAYGQLGNNAAASSSTPVTVSGLGGTVKGIAAGAQHTLALMADGTIKAWGYNYFGQLGDGSTTTRTLPVMVSGLADRSRLSLRAVVITLQ